MTTEPIAQFDRMPGHIRLGFGRPVTIRVFQGVLEFSFTEQKLLREPPVTYRQKGGVVGINEVLFPPWLNTVVLLHLKSGLPAHAWLPQWKRQRLKSALLKARFQLDVRRRVLMGSAE